VQRGNASSAAALWPDLFQSTHHEKAGGVGKRPSEDNRDPPRIPQPAGANDRLLVRIDIKAAGLLANPHALFCRMSDSHRTLESFARRTTAVNSPGESNEGAV